MEGLHLLPDLLQPLDWMVKLDLKDAYLQIPIHSDYQHLLTFQWEGHTYMFKSLPFGLSSAPRVITKLIKPVVGFLRQIGYRLIIYLDDILVMHQNKEQLQQITHLVCSLLENLGLMVNQKKSMTTPVQRLEFLGFQVCSISMKFTIPSEKLRKIKQAARKILDQRITSVREITQFVGKTAATGRAIPLAPLHYRALQMLMNSVMPLDYTQEEIARKYNTTLTLIPACKEDLSWWASLEKVPLGAPICNVPNSTGALRCIWKGLGSSAQWLHTDGGLWSSKEATYHINYLELLATFLVTKALGKDWQEITVLLQLDNITAVSYINWKGGTTSKLLCQLAISLWTWCSERKKYLMAEHLPGHLNSQADEESRIMKNRCDWMRNRTNFQ